jgi:prepilin-type N-terminal cleavage/methylation domain-containing protein
MKNFTTKRNKGYIRSSGFTLIEALIAIAILMLATTGPLFSASRAMVVAETSRVQLTASYLAQEGIEYVRAVRDNQYLALYPPGPTTATAAWTNFVSGFISSCASPNQCTLDPTLPMGSGSTNSLQTCGGSMGACTPLYLYGNLYHQYNIIPAGAVQTQFVRTIQVTTVSSTDERITSTVAWTFHGNPYSTTVAESLTPWQ